MAALPPFAAPDELFRVLEDVPDETAEGSLDYERALSLLEHASALVRNVARRSWVRLVDGEPAVVAPAAVVAICVQVARRAWVNPDADQTESDPAGAVTHAMNPDGRAPVHLTKDERLDIQRAAQRPAIGALRVAAGVNTKGLVPAAHPSDLGNPDRLRLGE